MLGNPRHIANNWIGRASLGVLISLILISHVVSQVQRTEPSYLLPSAPITEARLPDFFASQSSLSGCSWQLSHTPELWQMLKCESPDTAFPYQEGRPAEPIHFQDQLDKRLRLPSLEFEPLKLFEP